MSYAIPIINDLRTYSIQKFGSDLLAGITVAIVLVPQGMAYSLLAGLSPIYGLYAALIPMIIYPMFSSSKELSVGPVALMSIIVLSAVSLFAEPGTQQYLDIVLLVALLSGLFQLMFAVFRLGVFANFISKPVMSGFISAAGVIIAISQIKYLFSLDIPRSSSVLVMLKDSLLNIPHLNLYSVLLGVGGIIVLRVLSAIHKSIPGAIIIAAIGSIVLYFAGLHHEGVPIVGELPAGLPSFYAGFMQWENVINLLPSAFIISVICFIGSYSIAKTIAIQNRNYPLFANKELLGLGLAKVVGSFFLAMPSTGSFTRSAINHQAGAKTGMSSIFGAAVIGLTLVFFSKLFHYLPEPILAAIVITSVFSLIDYKEAIRLFRLDKYDFWILFLTFVLTLVLGIVNGILLGIALSLLAIVQKSSKPHYAILGRLPGTSSFRNINRYAEAEELTKTLIIRYDEDLFFGNADHFYNTMVTEIKKAGVIQTFILKAASFNHLDSTSMDKIKQLIQYCKDHNIRMILTNINGPMRDLFKKNSIYKTLGPENFHLNVSDACLDVDNQLSIKYAAQTNIDQKDNNSNTKQEQN